MAIAKNGNIANASEHLKDRLTLEHIYTYGELPDGEYRVIEIIDSKSGTVLIRNTRLNVEIDFVITGMPKHFFKGQLFLKWV